MVGIQAADKHALVCYVYQLPVPLHTLCALLLGTAEDCRVCTCKQHVASLTGAPMPPWARHIFQTQGGSA